MIRIVRRCIFESQSRVIWNCHVRSLVAQALPTTSESSNNFNRLDRILYNLDLNVRRTGRTLLSDVNNIIKIMESPDNIISSNQALLILRCCGDILPDEIPEKRSLLSLKIWKHFQDTGVLLDISHYNALLRVHIDNKYSFDPTNFLSELETKDITPNRVTYQLLIAKYCQNGDISGATTILEHMKAKDMAVNENVFHSLIMGHCRLNEYESAKNVISLMKDSGLNVGSETYMTYIIGLAGSEDWKEVKDIIIQYQVEGVQFHDRDFFQLILELVKYGKTEAAREAMDMLPKKSGYFQEMRNHIPQLVFAGESDLAFEILDGFRPPQFGSEGHNESHVRDNGIFILRAMVRNEFNLEKMLATLRKMIDNDPNSECVARVVEIAAELGKRDYGRNIVADVRSNFGVDCLKPSYHMNFIRSVLSRKNTEKDVIEFLHNITYIGMRMLPASLSEFLHKLIQPGEIVAPILIKIFQEQPETNSSANISWSLLCNAALQTMLNRETDVSFGDAVGFSLNCHFYYRPQVWNASLSRCYLVTNDLDSFISILFKASRRNATGKMEEFLMHENNVFRSLYHLHSLSHRYRPDSTSDEVLKTVLEELISKHIGIPLDVANMLKSNISDDVVQEMVNALCVLHEENDNYWTAEKENDFLASRQSLHRFNNYKIQPVHGKSLAQDDIPDDIVGMEKLYGVLRKRGVFNGHLSSKLINAYIRQDNVDQAIELHKAINKERDFGFPPQTVDDLTSFYTRKGCFEDALQFLINLGQKGAIFSSTLFQLFTQLLIEDKFNLFDIIKQFSPDVLVGDVAGNAADFLHHVALTKDVGKVETFYKFLVDLGFLGKGVPRSNHMSSLVEVHVNKEDYETAVSTFERIAKTDKRMPFKYSLMERLIDLEDTEKMQRVLDASIEVIGEERSLYDLVLNFLVAGKISQAKKLLETPGLRYNHDKISFLCQFLSERNKIDALEHLVYASRNIFACDRDYMFTTLIKAYSNDLNKVKEAWVNMQEEGHVPSERLKILMASAFENCDEKVPFEVPVQYRESHSTEHEASEIAVRFPERSAQNIKDTSNQPNRLLRAIDSKNESDVYALLNNDVKSSSNTFGSFAVAKGLSYLINCKSWAYAKAIALKLIDAEMYKELDLNRNIIRLLNECDEKQLVEYSDAFKSIDLRKKYLIDSRLSRIRSLNNFENYLDHMLTMEEPISVICPPLRVICEKLIDSKCASKALTTAQILAEKGEFLFAVEVMKAFAAIGNFISAEEIWNCVLNRNMPPAHEIRDRNFKILTVEQLENVLTHAKKFDGIMFDLQRIYNELLRNAFLKNDMKSAQRWFDEAYNEGNVKLDQFITANLKRLTNLELPSGVNQQVIDLLKLRTNS